MSGPVAASQSTRRGSRTLSELTFQVASFKADQSCEGGVVIRPRSVASRRAEGCHHRSEYRRQLLAAFPVMSANQPRQPPDVMRCRQQIRDSRKGCFETMLGPEVRKVLFR